MKEFTRREALQYSLLAGGLLALPSALAACRDSPDSAKSKNAETLNVGLVSTVTNLDPAAGLVWWGLTAGIVGLERLIQPSDNGQLLPWLAESWSSPDDLTYVFQIRKGVKFWDGTPMTVDDVVFSLQHAAASKSQTYYYFKQVKSFEATGSSEVTVHMSTPFPLFVNGLTYAPIFPKKFVEDKGAKFGTPAGSTLTVMGTGPYKFTSFTSTGITAIRNDGYWGKKPTIEKIKFSFITDPQTLQLAFRSGSVDWVPDIPLDQSPQWQSISNSTVMFSQPMASIFLAFNVTKPPFNDVHVRRAVAYCCNGSAMVRALLHGHAEPATTVVPPAQWGDLASPGQVRQYYSQLPKYPFDLAKARQELAKSASPRGFSTTILIPQVNGYWSDAAIAISQNLKAIGITLNVKSVPTDQWSTDAYSSHNQSIYWLEFLPDYANPANYPTGIYASAQAIPNGNDIADYKNPHVDALLSNWYTADRSRQVRDILQVLRIAQEDVPYVPLWWAPTAAAINDSFSYKGQFITIFYEQQWANRIAAVT